MEKSAEIFFEHFGLRPGSTSRHVHSIAETFSEIPWENLTKFLLKASGKVRPRLSEEVMNGYVTSGTGGTCYSLTEALGRIVSACGLSARPLTGHMNHGRNIHCALLVQGDSGTFILDPGYAVPGAVELRSDGSGSIGVSGREMLWKPVSGGWELHTVENGETRYRYALESRALTRKEFLSYWEESFHSTGLGSLHLNRSGSMGGRLSAHNENLRTVGEGLRKNTKLSEDYAGLVHEYFGVSPEIAEAAWTELQRQRGKGRNVTA